MSVRKESAAFFSFDDLQGNAKGSGYLVPENETGRLAALRSYEALYTAPEAEFEDLTRLAAYICETPIAFISLVDSERVWFKSNLGLQLAEVPRTNSFCQHTIMNKEALVVDDASKTGLFRNNPLVIGGHSICFYAGAPLINSEGFALGTLSVSDIVPRQLSGRQREALQILARNVVSHLEIRRARISTQEEKDKLENLLRVANSSVEKSFQVNKNYVYVKQNSRLVKINASDILWIEALGDYVNIHTCTDRFTVYTTMKDMENKLLARDFVRVHRKYIIRVDKISAIEDESALIEKHDVYNAGHTMNGLMYVPIGSSYKAALIKRLNLI